MAPETRSMYQHNADVQPKSNRLILCFDGTGNEFKGAPGDTNIVKLYNMFDRTNEHQMHYYQPGIGTYPAEGPVNVNFYRTVMRKFEAGIDQALATSFDSHVIAGYKFVMRYYKPGAKIYIFGFSRGAYTARFLARMISHVGLLSIGNEELVPFAYKVYQEYEQNRGGKSEEKEDFMNSFKKHFCRTEPWEKGDSDNESGIKVHFLGLFDCVSSVGNLDVPFFQKAPPLPAARGTAHHVRHAVSIDERRVKFKAALFSQEKDNPAEDIKEVWFPGNHGDVGGGWDNPDKEKARLDKIKKRKENAKLENANGDAHGEANGDADAKALTDNEDDYFQLSDIALKWMVDEVDAVETSCEKDHEDHDNRIAWAPVEKASFIKRSQMDEHKKEMIEAQMHDTMKTGVGGSSASTALLWNFMEYLPWVIKRWEYVESPQNSKNYVWDYIGWPPNRGERRDIPSTALFHHSVIGRMCLSGKNKYVPNNHLWVQERNAQLANGTSKTTKAPELLKTNLDKLAKQYPLKGAANSDSETTQLLERPHIYFEHVKKLTTGSVAIENEDVVIGPTEWDQIYCVAQKN